MSSFALNDAIPLSVAQGFGPPPSPWTEVYWGPAIFMGGGVPAVTGTGAWVQAAATWSATLSERIAATATFAQTASWDSSASERFAFAASFVQTAATWDAAALERLTATAEWTQTTAWVAEALVTNPITATATFEQAAAEWESLATERFEAAAAFLQAPAAFDAVASESIPSSATFEQTQAWAALGQSAEDVSAEATWTQSATWAAEAQTNVAEEPQPEPEVTPTQPHGVRIGPAYSKRPTPTPLIAATATFAQAPAAWQSLLTVNDDALVLALV